MPTLPQVTLTEQHVIAFDAALRDARTQLPRTADATRADRGLVLALNGAVTLFSTTEAHVRSAHGLRPLSLVPGPLSLAKDEGQRTMDSSASEVVYHVHSRGGCDCPDGARRLLDMADVAPVQRACKHWHAAVLTAMAHLNLALKGYVPEVETVWYPAVSLEEQWFGHSGYAQEQADGSWWFCFADWNGGFYTDTLSLELYERTPLHVIDWQGAVQRWERWLQGR